MGLPVDPDVVRKWVLPWDFGTLALMSAAPASWISVRVRTGIFAQMSGVSGLSGARRASVRPSR